MIIIKIFFLSFYLLIFLYMNKLENDYVFFSDWINYWYSKQSVFVKKISEDNYKTLSYWEVLNMFYYDEAKSNLFFSINWYKYWAKTRDEKNIEKINCFYFDIDMKDNKLYKKVEVKNILEKFLDSFDIVCESRNGFHMYILLEEWQYTIKDKDKYIEDWREKWKEIEKLLWVTLDNSIYSLSRISRIPLSNHQKKGDNDFFEIEYMKWKEIISPLKLRESKINDIDIILVINKLYDEKLNNIYVLNEKIYRWDEESSWLKINKAKNYIRDFSRDDFQWNNFDIVRKIFNDKLSDTIKDKNKLYSETLMKTYNFFAKHFWIISINE